MFGQIQHLLNSAIQVYFLNNYSSYVLILSWQSVSPTQFVADPSAFRGVPPLTLSVCPQDTLYGLICLYNTILGDSDPVPPQPNLDNSGGGNSDILKFLVWPSSTDRPYVTFTFGGTLSITALNIEFLNYPAQGFSLPNLELYSTAAPTIVDPNSPRNQRIEFELQNNNVLSQDDYQVTSVSLSLLETLSTPNLLLYWNYTGVYNLDFFMVSEVDFCSNTQPPGETQITFQDPQSDNSVIIPTVEELTVARYITLNCTVSSSGLFEWQWKQSENGRMLSNNSRFSLFTADGTRTSILQITELSVSDATEYTCEARRRRGGKMTRIQTLSLPGILY